MIKIGYYLNILRIHGILNFFLIFSIFLGIWFICEFFKVVVNVKKNFSNKQDKTQIHVFVDMYVSRVNHIWKFGGVLILRYCLETWSFVVLI
jgi:hypothetical protein